VAIVYRHATMEADGEESTMAKPIIKKDFVYGISAEKTHDVQVRWDNLVFIGMQHIFDDGSARYSPKKPKRKRFERERVALSAP
jgi:hypothetical protein